MAYFVQVITISGCRCDYCFFLFMQIFCSSRLLFCASVLFYIYFFGLTLLICISCFNSVYHVFGIGIGRFSVDLMIECVAWWILRVISARWLALHRLSPSVVVDVITGSFLFMCLLFPSQTYNLYLDYSINFCFTLLFVGLQIGLIPLFCNLF